MMMEKLSSARRPLRTIASNIINVRMQDRLATVTTRTKAGAIIKVMVLTVPTGAGVKGVKNVSSWVALTFWLL